MKKKSAVKKKSRIIPFDDVELMPEPRYVGRLLVVDWPDPKPEFTMLNSEMLPLLFEAAYGFPLVDDHGLDEFFALSVGKVDGMIAEANRRADTPASS